MLAVLIKTGQNRLHANDDVRLVEAIAEVESGGNDDAVGPETARGERAVGRYQMLPSTWRDRTSWPIEYAHDHLKARIVAVKHLQWLRARLEARKDVDQVTQYHLVCAWRYGHANLGKFDTVDKWAERMQYAARVRNMYEFGIAPCRQPLID